MNRTLYPMLQAILAAVLFGASAPLAKLLLGSITPIPLAAFLYLGSGLGLLLYQLLKNSNPQSCVKEARIAKSDIPWLIGAVFAGGVAAPIVLMSSLRYTPAATASLLLNFEGVATTLIAAFFFKEAIGKRVWLAIGVITAASILLSYDLRGQWGISPSSAGILCACLLWGMDNNFTNHISTKNPIIIAMIKGISAGTFSLILALSTTDIFPGLSVIFKSMLLGLVSYGASVVLFILAMRGLGVARTSAFFSTAPFVGAFMSFLIFRELPNALFFISLPIMILGTWLIFKENHHHVHQHQEIEHEHRHCHNDGHHLHDHDAEELSKEHSHRHTHEALEHNHPHTPDSHHRHPHE